jgi:hypothetical protein
MISPCRPFFFLSVSKNSLAVLTAACEVGMQQPQTNSLESKEQPACDQLGVGQDTFPG